MASRRRFLKVGLAGTVLLAAARWLPPASAALARSFLDEPRARRVAALVPVVLDGALPAAAEARATAVREVVEAFDRAVAGLAPAVREELSQLFALLEFAPTRYALAGLAEPIEASTPEQLTAFLQSWRTSRFDLLRAGYQALTQLLQAAWYDNPSAWAAIGYPGPPALVKA